MVEDRSLLLVHAHPDDESIVTGATMAKYVAEGAHVTLVTCTRGEEGEIVDPALAHLTPGESLAAHRMEELAIACAALGVRDHRYLGGPGRFRDSGMMGTPPNDASNSFWRADLDEAAQLLVEIIHEVRPQVVITYDEVGAYGHPDHIKAHQVTVAALERAVVPVAKLYYTATPKSVLAKGLAHLRERADEIAFELPASVEDYPFGVPDELVTTRVDGREHYPAKMAALRAHRSQISVDGPFFALADDVGQEAFGFEHFRIARGKVGDDSGPNGWEQELFAGVGG